MTLHARAALLTKTGLLLALGLAFGAETLGRAADPKDPLVSDADYPKLVKRFTKGIAEALKGTPNDENISKARVAAVLLASAAQQNLSGADGQQRATVRDAALKVADTLKAGNAKEAAKLAEAIPTLEADPKAKKEKIKLEGHIEFPPLMHQFRPVSRGGWGVYSRLNRISTSMKPALPREELKDDFVLEAEQIVLTADLALGQKFKTKPEEYQKRMEALRTGAQELVEALKDKDAAKVGAAAVSRLTTTCLACHKDLREKP